MRIIIRGMSAQGGKNVASQPATLATYELKQLPLSSVVCLEHPLLLRLVFSNLPCSNCPVKLSRFDQGAVCSVCGCWSDLNC